MLKLSHAGRSTQGWSGALALLCACGSPTASTGGAGAAGVNAGGAGAANVGGSAVDVGGAGLGSVGGAGVASVGGAGGASLAGSRNDGGAGAGGSANAGTAGGAGQAATCPFGGDQYLLWSGAAPGGEGVTLTEVFTERSNDPAVNNRSVTDVSKPSLYPYRVQQPNSPAAIVMPGGGYTSLAWDKEGLDIAVWLNSQGIAAFVLKYRSPADFPEARWVALADAQRAMRAVRHAAAACSINAGRIGVVGFSAGGHLASELATRPAAVTAPPKDTIDTLDARPDFAVLMYPVISMDPGIAHAGSRTALLGPNPSAVDVALHSSELQVTAATPPTFLGVSNQDTSVKPENTQRFADGLEAAGIAHELHRYQDGAHGTGIREATGDMAQWPKQCEAWLKALLTK